MPRTARDLLNTSRLSETQLGSVGERLTSHSNQQRVILLEGELLMEPHTSSPLTDEPVATQQQTQTSKMMARRTVFDAVVVVTVIITCSVSAFQVTISFMKQAIRRGRGWCFVFFFSHVEIHRLPRRNTSSGMMND